MAEKSLASVILSKCVCNDQSDQQRGHMLQEEGKASRQGAYNLIELMVWRANGLISPTHISPHLHMPKSTSGLQSGSLASRVITRTEHQNLQKWCQQLGKLLGVAVEQSFKERYGAKDLTE